MYIIPRNFLHVVSTPSLYTAILQSGDYKETFRVKKVSKNLVKSKKSSTFAAVCEIPHSNDVRRSEMSYYQNGGGNVFPLGHS
jgi:hypothetical protein